MNGKEAAGWHPRTHAPGIPSPPQRCCIPLIQPQRSCPPRRQGRRSPPSPPRTCPRHRRHRRCSRWTPSTTRRGTRCTRRALRWRPACRSHRRGRRRRWGLSCTPVGGVCVCVVEGGRGAQRQAHDDDRQLTDSGRENSESTRRQHEAQGRRHPSTTTCIDQGGAHSYILFSLLPTFPLARFCYSTSFSRVSFLIHAQSLVAQLSLRQ